MAIFGHVVRTYVYTYYAYTTLQCSQHSEEGGHTLCTAKINISELLVSRLILYNTVIAVASDMLIIVQVERYAYQ